MTQKVRKAYVQIPTANIAELKQLIEALQNAPERTTFVTLDSTEGHSTRKTQVLPQPVK